MCGVWSQFTSYLWNAETCACAIFKIEARKRGPVNEPVLHHDELEYHTFAITISQIYPFTETKF